MKQLAAVGFLCWLGAVGAAESSVVDDVDVFIGTSGSGHAFPAASFPFGMVQA